MRLWHLLLAAAVGLVVLGTGGAVMTRGYRNNNPGNIRWDGSTQWQGQTGADSAGFVVFSAPEYGYRAIARVLRSYERQGIRTVQGIINRWAPPNENDTGSYVRHVAASLGVHASQAISVDAYMLPLVKVIARHENGYLAHSDALIVRGVNMA